MSIEIKREQVLLGIEREGQGVGVRVLCIVSIGIKREEGRGILSIESKREGGVGVLGIVE